MVLRARVSLAFVVALGVVVFACKEPPAPTSAADEDLILASIETQGGIALLKKGSTFTARYEGKLQGNKLKGSLKHNAGATRVEYIAPNKDPAIQVAANGKCWQQIGKAVLPCLPPLRKHTTRLAKLLEASWLFPVQERTDLKVKPSKVELAGGKSYDGMTVLESGAPVGALAFDKTSGLVVGLRMQTNLTGNDSTFVGVFSEFEKHCGVEIPTKREYTLDGKIFLTEKIGGLICEAVEIKLFDRPEQVKHGHIEIKHKNAATYACTRLKGPYTGIKAALGKVLDHMKKHDVPPGGPAVLIHQKGPPTVKRPAGFVTDVCYMVGDRALLVPKSVWKGGFYLRATIADETLAGFALGDYAKTTAELPGMMLADAKKRGRSQAGLTVHLLYMLPDDYPPEDCVTEMHITLD